MVDQVGERATDAGESGSPKPLSRTQEGSVERARTVAHLLDESLRIPGTGFRIGLDPIVGLLPVAGDTVAAVASLYIVFVGFSVGLPKRSLAKMLGFVAADYLLGSVPVLGSGVDAVLKVNRRNLATIEAFVADE